MTDIANRLRTFDYRGNPPPVLRLMAEAADEIDRLRWALAAANAALDRAHQVAANE